MSARTRCGPRPSPRCSGAERRSTGDAQRDGRGAPGARNTAGRALGRTPGAGARRRTSSSAVATTRHRERRAAGPCRARRRPASRERARGHRSRGRGRAPTTWVPSSSSRSSGRRVPSPAYRPMRTCTSGSSQASSSSAGSVRSRRSPAIRSARDSRPGDGRPPAVLGAVQGRHPPAAGALGRRGREDDLVGVCGRPRASRRSARGTRRTTWGTPRRGLEHGPLDLGVVQGDGAAHPASLGRLLGRSGRE